MIRITVIIIGMNYAHHIYLSINYGKSICQLFRNSIFNGCLAKYRVLLYTFQNRQKNMYRSTNVQL